MAGEIPTTEEIREAARQGRPIMADDVSDITQTESEVTGGGPMRGGPSGQFISSRFQRLFPSCTTGLPEEPLR